MANFKFELWEIENGVVITRPTFLKEEDGSVSVKNSSLYREDPLVALKEIQVALDSVKAEYTRRQTKH